MALDRPATHSIAYSRLFIAEAPLPSTPPLSPRDASYHEIPSPRRQAMTEMHPPPIPPASDPAGVPPDNEESKSDKRKGKRRVEEDWAVTSDSQLSAALAPKARKRIRKPRGRAGASNDTTSKPRWDFKNYDQLTYLETKEKGKRKRRSSQTSSSSLETSLARESGSSGKGTPMTANTIPTHAGAR